MKTRLHAEKEKLEEEDRDRHIAKVTVI